MNGAALDRESIRQLIVTPGEGQPPLVERLVDLEQQLQPSGFDLSMREVGRLITAGKMGRSPDERELSSTESLDFESDGWVNLAPGPYLVTFNEVVNMPLDLMALGSPRSSLLRSGVGLYTAVWDPGYRGRSQALLTVHSAEGYRVQRDARLLQIVFFQLTHPVQQGYDGRYQGERP